MSGGLRRPKLGMVPARPWRMSLALTALWALPGCRGAAAPSEPVDSGAPDASPAPPRERDGGDTEPVDARGDEPEAGFAPNVDCDVPLELPLEAKLLMGPSSEDFTFDVDGHLLLMQNGRSLVRLDTTGRVQLVAPNVVANGRGMQTMPGGDVIIADPDRSLVVRLDSAGGVRRLTTAIANPNGVALGPGSQLYVTDFHLTGELFRVDADTGEAEAIAQPSLASNGVTFSPDFDHIYVGDHDEGRLYRLRLEPGGAVSEPEEWATGLGRPDGLTTDVCGNVYAASWDARLYVVSPEGEVRMAAEFDGAVSSVRFGSGKHGWDEHSLYAMAIEQGGVYEIPIPRASAPRPRP